MKLLKCETTFESVPSDAPTITKYVFMVIRDQDNLFDLWLMILIMTQKGKLISNQSDKHDLFVVSLFAKFIRVLFQM